MTPSARRVIQVCPNDSPPFADICRAYQIALSSLGYCCDTVFIEMPSREPIEGAIYLGVDSRSMKLASDMLALELFGESVIYDLAVCHRYRSLQLLRKFSNQVRKSICIAHEFSMFRTFRRKIDYLLFFREVIFSGVSESVGSDLRRTVANAVVIPNAIDLDDLNRRLVPATQAKQFFRLESGAFNIGVVGRLHRKKQPLLAIQAFLKFVDLVPDARMTFVGDGELSESLRSMAESSGIRFSGFVDSVSSKISAFDVILITSGDQEAFNMVALEAMAAGVRVIAGSSPGPTYVLGDSAIYFQEFTANSVSRALLAAYRETEEIKNTEKMRGRRRASSYFSISALTARLKDLF